jgi:hypothetical protein
MINAKIIEKYPDIFNQIKKYDFNNPTITDVKEIVYHCCNVEENYGFLWFLLAFVKVPHATLGTVPLKDNIYSWQSEAAVEFLKNRQFIFHKPRQTSATTLTVTYFLWRALFFSNQDIAIVSLGQREANDTLQRAEVIYENLPIWLKSPKTEDAKTSMRFKNGSRIRSLPYTMNVLRGSSPSAVLIDEAAFVDKLGMLLSAVGPALGTGKNTPWTNKTIPSQLFLVSTFPLTQVEDNEYMRIYNNSLEDAQNSKFKLINIDTEDIPQYKDPEWHTEMRELLGQKRYNTEVLCILNTTMDNTFLPEDFLSELKHDNPIRYDILDKTMVDEHGYPIQMDIFHESKEEFDKKISYMKGLWIWNDPIPGRDYGVAVDVATGTGGDYSAFLVFDLENNEQVAEFKNNKVNLEDFKFIIETVTMYYNKAKLCIERNSMGSPLCSYFYDTLEYENMYLHKKNKHMYLPGLPVTAANRGNILASMQTMMIRDGMKLKSVRLINELRNFGFTQNGQLKGMNGAHDDLVMACAQYCYLKNIFFATDKNEDYSEEFIRNVELQENIIKKRNFQNIYEDLDMEDAKHLEMLNMVEGYSVDKRELKRYLEMLNREI